MTAFMVDLCCAFLIEIIYTLIFEKLTINKMFNRYQP